MVDLMLASMQPSHTSQDTGGSKGERKEPLLFCHFTFMLELNRLPLQHWIFIWNMTRFLLLGFMDVRVKALDCVTNCGLASNLDFIWERRPKMERWIHCSPSLVYSSPLLIHSMCDVTSGALRMVWFCSQLQRVWAIEQTAQKTREYDPHRRSY